MALSVLRLALLLLAVTFAGSARSGPGERGPPEKSGFGSQTGGGPCPAPGGLGDGTRAPVTGGSPEDLPGKVVIILKSFEMDPADGAVYRKEDGETTFTGRLDKLHFPFFSFPVFLYMRFVNTHFLRAGMEDSHV
ncbi:serine peptidase inhibitor Kazal type 2 [Homo sapiens]|uniref:Serine peptidase inhibitor Kazal type 2 n=1 Tax=Homo sapiens TaxID=9606 RepID=A0A087WTA9_HUMAN|nr:serine protease inhibitor Kazal-type 2 isoform 6 precursor [Homo sapiens]KAI2534423.1 serine peptidase inhibitor Kazal type 2 [Homo sapiens]KAI4025525.1 serine peptidase inhibitor Kazal type 2 [Homo sapiens]|eukprot:NP_001258651.1 serine protease inhibitor Kazal-type 2 isoform 6 precursor [Homo sapiens]